MVNYNDCMVQTLQTLPWIESKTQILVHNLLAFDATTHIELPQTFNSWFKFQLNSLHSSFYFLMNCSERFLISSCQRSIQPKFIFKRSPSRQQQNHQSLAAPRWTIIYILPQTNVEDTSIVFFSSLRFLLKTNLSRGLQIMSGMRTVALGRTWSRDRPSCEICWNFKKSSWSLVSHGFLQTMEKLSQKHSSWSRMQREAVSGLQCTLNLANLFLSSSFSRVSKCRQLLTHSTAPHTAGDCSETEMQFATKLYKVKANKLLHPTLDSKVVKEMSSSWLFKN